MQTCTTSTLGSRTSSSAESKARSAPSSAAAARADSGDEAATPARWAPARRAERAWIRPMNPAPAIAASSGIGVEPKRDLVQLSSKSCRTSSKPCFTFLGRRDELAADPVLPDQRRRALAPDPRGGCSHAGRPGSRNRAGAFHGRPTGRRAPRPRPRLRGRRQPSTGGRPATVLAFNRDAGVVLVADLGATHARVAVSDLVGTPLAERADDLDIALGPDHALAWVAECFADLLDEVGRSAGDVRGIGVGVPGRSSSTAGGRSIRRSCRAGTTSPSPSGSPASTARRCWSTTTSTSWPAASTGCTGPTPSICS